MSGAATGGRRVRDEADARACLAAMDASGMKLYGWARANGVAVRSLGRWRERVALLDAQAKRGVTKVDDAAPRKPMGESEARRLLTAWERVGGPLAPWCRSNGVSSDVLYRWRDRLTASEQEVPPRLVEVVSAATPEVLPAARYDVLVGRFRVVVGDDFADATLTRLLRVVASC